MFKKKVIHTIKVDNNIMSSEVKKSKIFHVKYLIKKLYLPKFLKIYAKNYVSS